MVYDRSCWRMLLNTVLLGYWVATYGDQTIKLYWFRAAPYGVIDRYLVIAVFLELDIR